MDFTHIKTTKFSFIIFENIYEKNQEEFWSIYKECIFLCDSKKLELTEDSGAARNPDGSLRKTNKSLFLEKIYTEPYKFSNYLRVFQKPFSMMSFDQIASMDENFYFFNKPKFLTNTIFSYYQNGDYYLSHKDSSEYTFVYWLFNEPKQFSGGDFILNDIDYRVEVKNNMGILFPSNALHTVEMVEMEDKTPYNRNGRFSLTTFIQ
jgi:Rps23 Pro-64 3,4-dihydroxylase Tpa1-like proline 4-hydroxylase